VQHGNKTPDTDKYSEALFGPDFIKHSPGAKQTNGVGPFKSRYDNAIISLRPSEHPRKFGRKYAQHLPVQIVNGSGEKQQCAYLPAVLVPVVGYAGLIYGHIQQKFYQVHKPAVQLGKAQPGNWLQSARRPALFYFSKMLV
jgi:hypothetical protein